MMKVLIIATMVSTSIYKCIKLITYTLNLHSAREGNVEKAMAPHSSTFA